MKAARVKHIWVKVLPWYYTRRTSVSRQTELQDALSRETDAEGDGE